MGNYNAAIPYNSSISYNFPGRGLSARARIVSLSGPQTVLVRAKIAGNVLQTVSVRARLAAPAPTMTGRGRIVVPTAPTTSAIARIHGRVPQTMSAKALIIENISHLTLEGTFAVASAQQLALRGFFYSYTAGLRLLRRTLGGRARIAAYSTSALNGNDGLVLTGHFSVKLPVSAQDAQTVNQVRALRTGHAKARIVSE